MATAGAEALARAARLPCWRGPVAPEPLSGGITNHNFRVSDGALQYVVRIGADILVHQVMRFNELAASRAAHAAGLAPEVVYAEPGVLVLRYIEGKTLTPEAIRARAMLERIVPLLRRCHHDVAKHLRGPVLAFWVFHVLRDYAHTLREARSRMAPELPALMAKAERLEQWVGPIDLVFGHNDLLAANVIDDGQRLWLVDWEYAGFNSPLFDLGGLASNNDLGRADEEWLLEAYFDQPVNGGLRRRYHAMKCASLLREALWSLVSEHHSRLDFDYRAYTAENLRRFTEAWRDLRAD
ncbi:MAG: phosphotransferase [Gammaproteobacteria bacterium]